MLTGDEQCLQFYPPPITAQLWVCVPFSWMLSHFSHVHLFVILWTGAHQAPLSLGFSRQEYWSGLPFPSPGESFWPRDWTCISCIGWQILYHWAPGKLVSLGEDKEKHESGCVDGWHSSQWELWLSLHFSPENHTRGHSVPFHCLPRTRERRPRALPQGWCFLFLTGSCKCLEAALSRSAFRAARTPGADLRFLIVMPRWPPCSFKHCCVVKT